ncbi:Phosphotransferase system, phosphocarrier protein HPr [Denitrovibrio acetiphilus DSM 12809]|uniref:Phosphotransferase system, phosphocarrier protein HPr n=1 Tax=Denitrovibrio acetiphilus (strain DSM 12809 / NBRC 114555 / N2460) TaxID=522772 RepID=D4H7U1_DENA2|nr:HPr family phosphocarrier protein [Denitrovibrio acetiphilus]ADD68090.1 Phosphotransferase system, phosphocarrier protein HPr [Denitrovibrio acetiphilus DSM 12809]
MGVKEEIEIVNELGMHARAAGAFVKTSEKFRSDIKVKKDGMEVNGKSIMGLMMLAASKGSCISVDICGEDEEEALSALKELISSRFGEER